MRTLLFFTILLLGFGTAAAQPHSEWQVVRSEVDGFSIEFPGTPKISTAPLANGGTQKNFAIEAAQETYLVSVIQLAKGSIPANPGEPYFDILLKAYVDGSKTTLRSSRMITLAGQAGKEGIADAESAVHLVDITVLGDRIYLVVFAGPKGQESGARATHLRDSLKLLAAR
jgi:hypothetical protein